MTTLLICLPLGAALLIWLLPLNRVSAGSLAVLAAVAEGDMLRTQLAILRRLLKHTPQDTIALSRSVAQRQLDAGGYKL